VFVVVLYVTGNVTVWRQSQSELMSFLTVVCMLSDDGCKAIGKPNEKPN
jgi:hypothetical protein